MRTHSRLGFQIAFASLLLMAAMRLAAQSPVISTTSIGPNEADLALVNRDENIPFGAAVAISGRTAMASIPSLRRVAVFRLTKAGWARTATLLPSDGGTFGTALDLDGNTVVISGTQDSNTTTISSLYLFKRRGRDWQEFARAELDSPQHSLGSSVQLENGVIATSVTRIDESPSPEPGAVYIYELTAKHQDGAVEKTATTDSAKHRLRRTAIVQANDGFPGDQFGASLAMEGPLLAVGAPGADAVYVFLDVGTQWMQIAKLTSSDGAGIGFGSSVALRKGVILIGAPSFDLPGDEPTIPEGNAYVFLATRQGWVESQKLNGTGGQAFVALFGSKVAMGDGLVAVSTPINEAVARAIGRIIVFDWVGDELRFGRSVTQIEGTAGTDLDFSGRVLIAGMMESSAFVERAIGRARILQFGRDLQKTTSVP